MADWWDQLRANHGAYLERGGLPGVIWGMLPPEARRAFEPWGQLLNPLEWTPGAGVRDTLEASGNLTRATLEGRPLGMLNALGGMALGIASIPPGGVPVAKTAKEIAKLPMDVASRLARAADMGFDRTLAARFGTAPEGEKLAGAALKAADGRVFTGPTHVDAMEDVESKLRRSWLDLPQAPIPEGFVTRFRPIHQSAGGDVYFGPAGTGSNHETIRRPIRPGRRGRRACASSGGGRPAYCHD